MMKLFVKYILMTGVTFLFGCTMYSYNTPFANVENLGTVLCSGESLSITNELGIVVVEYLAPTKRRIIWNGESRDISLNKSLYLNGIYTLGVKIKPPIDNISRISYSEKTPNIRTEQAIREYIALNQAVGFEYRNKESFLVKCELIEEENYLCVYIECIKKNALKSDFWSTPFE